MSAFKGTPGPWRVVDRGIWDISVEADGTVAHVNNKGEWFPSDGGESTSGRSHNTMLADARLIAAAPELLSCLDMTAHGLEVASRVVGGELGAVFSDRAMSARAAIAKATGGDA